MEGGVSLAYKTRVEKCPRPFNSIEGCGSVFDCNKARHSSFQLANASTMVCFVVGVNAKTASVIWNWTGGMSAAADAGLKP